MSAPDKIYIQPSTIDELPRQNIVYTKRLSYTSIEYIRKDALLEWVREEQAKCPDDTHPYYMFMNVVLDKLYSM